MNGGGHHANIGHWQASDHKRQKMLDAAGNAGRDITMSKALQEAHTAYESRGAEQLAVQSQPRVMEYKKGVRSIRVPSCSPNTSETKMRNPLAFAARLLLAVAILV